MGLTRFSSRPLVASRWTAV